MSIRGIEAKDIHYSFVLITQLLYKSAVSKQKYYLGLPWWLSGKESTSQNRRPLGQEDPTCHGATKPTHHN